jgi:excisionase family DNA binding protein
VNWLDENIVYTTREAIKYLKISKPTFLKFVHSGKIKAVKVGNGWRVSQSELLRLLKPEEKSGHEEIGTQDSRKEISVKTKRNPRVNS